MNCIQNYFTFSLPSPFKKTIIGITSILAITVIALGIIGLIPKSLSPFNALKGLGSITNGALIGSAFFILTLNFLWLAALCKTNGQTPSHFIKTNKLKVSQKNGEFVLSEDANGEALYELMTPLARKRNPRQTKQPYRANLSSHKKKPLTALQSDWKRTFQAMTTVTLTLPSDFCYSFSQLDVSPFVNTKCMVLEDCRGTLPKGLKKLPLEELHLKNAELEFLPKGISQMALKVLEIDGCKMDRIPEAVYKLSSLERLCINNLKNQKDAAQPGKLILDIEACSKLKSLPHLKVLKIVNSGWKDDDLNLTHKLHPIEIVFHDVSTDFDFSAC